MKNKKLVGLSVMGVVGVASLAVGFALIGSGYNEHVEGYSNAQTFTTALNDANTALNERISQLEELLGSYNPVFIQRSQILRDNFETNVAAPAREIIASEFARSSTLVAGAIVLPVMSLIVLAGVTYVLAISKKQENANIKTETEQK